MGQGFNNGDLFGRLYAGLRENPLVYTLYLRLFSSDQRNAVRGASTTIYQSTEIRQPSGSEMCRNFFAVCRKEPLQGAFLSFS